MSAQGKIRWLHLSDFQVRKGDEGQKQFFRDIHQHIASRIQEHGEPDFVFITGDIANAGLDNEYATFLQEFLTPLRKPSGRWEIFMVPGSHDIDRNKVSTRSNTMSWLHKKQFFKPTQIGLEYRKHILPRFDAYLRRINYPPGWLKSLQGFYTKRSHTNGVKVGILGLNTAWLVTDDEDRRTLSPGVPMVRKGLHTIADCQVKIVLGHHPLSWFRKEDYALIKALFVQANVIYLHGHLYAEIESEEVNIQVGSTWKDAVWRNRIVWGEIDAVQKTVGLEPFIWMEGVEWQLDNDAFTHHKQVGLRWVYPLPQTANEEPAEKKPDKTPKCAAVTKKSKAEMEKFRQKVLHKIQHQMDKPQCADLVDRLAENIQPSVNVAALGATLCKPSSETFSALLVSVKTCFDLLDEVDGDKKPLAYAMQNMLNWLLLLTVDDDWIEHQGYLIALNESEELRIQIPMRTNIGIEIVASRIHEVACGFANAEAGHDLLGQGSLMDSGEIGWHNADVVNEVKRALWESLFKEAPPDTFSEKLNDRLNVMIKTRIITQEKHYLAVPLLEGANPLNNHRLYGLLMQELPSLKVIFIGGADDDVLVLEEPILMTWVSELYRYIRKALRADRPSAVGAKKANALPDFDNKQGIDRCSKSWDKEKLSKSFAQWLTLVQDFWHKIDPETAPELKFVKNFLDVAENCLVGDLFQYIRLLQRFLKKWKRDNIQFPNTLLEDALKFSFDLTTHYNQNIAPLCAQPLYTRLPSLALTQTPFSAHEHKNALPLSLRQIAIADFQCIDRVQLFDLPPNAPWIFVVGENGDGKTSFLQALALACTGDHGVHELFHKNTEIDIELYQEATEQEQTEKNRHFRYFSWDQEEKHSNTVPNKRRFKSLDRQLESQQWDESVSANDRKTQPSIPCILGYSASRLKAEKTLNDEEKNNPVHNLLRQQGSLEKFEEWLQKQVRALDNPEYTQAQKAIMRLQSENARALLCRLTLNNVEKIQIQGENVLYFEKGVPTRWDHLSTGHKSMIAMIGDLLIRLFASQPNIADPSELCGLVLIDEIETHLHPKWEIQLPTLLSTHFPKVQFIGSSHSALPLLGAPEGSIILKVSRDANKRSQVQRIDIDLANLTPNLILTSSIFDLEQLLSVQNKDIAHVHTHEHYEDVIKSKKQAEKLAEIAPQMNELFSKYLDEDDD